MTKRGSGVLPHWLSALAARSIRILPNMFLWWDPRLREAQHPATAYPRFSTHALAQTMRIGDDVYGAAARDAFSARSVAVVTNKDDPAVNNDVTARVVSRWKRFRPDAVTAFEFDDLPVNHDIIEPDNPRARTGAVYPKLLELIDS